jgi:hypothetical protein
LGLLEDWNGHPQTLIHIFLELSLLSYREFFEVELDIKDIHDCICPFHYIKNAPLLIEFEPVDEFVESDSLLLSHGRLALLACLLLTDFSRVSSF